MWRPDSLNKIKVLTSSAKSGKSTLRHTCSPGPKRHTLKHAYEQNTLRANVTKKAAILDLWALFEEAQMNDTTATSEVLAPPPPYTGMKVLTPLQLPWVTRTPL